LAIWQFRLDLIPTSALRAKFHTVPISIPGQLAEDYGWWSEVQPSAGFEKDISSMLPEANSWSEEMLIWGDERGDTAAVCYDLNRKIEWIGFRIDVGTLSLALVRQLCKFAKDQECMLLTGSYHLIEPDEQAVLAAINHSTAKKFLSDPASTLLSLRPTKSEVVRLPKKTKETG
jgi:hypothetical protein